MSYGRSPYYIIGTMNAAGTHEFFNFVDQGNVFVERDAVAQLIASMYSYDNPKDKIAEFKGEFGDLLRRGLELRPNLYKERE